MRNLTLCLYALSVILLFAVFSRRPALADEPVSVASVPEHPTQIDVAQPLPAETLDVEILRALRYWTGQPEDMLRPWAAAIADVAHSRAEAIWIASQAAVESRFAPEVLSFECNDAAYRAAHIPTECDTGFAFSPWQIHDMKLRGAPVEEQVRTAAQWMRARPQAWTTWRSARAQADFWGR